MVDVLGRVWILTIWRPRSDMAHLRQQDSSDVGRHGSMGFLWLYGFVGLVELA